LGVSQPKVIIAFGEHLRKLRLEKGLTQQELAIDANVARSTIQRVEGAQIVPTLDLLYALSQALHIPLKELVDFEIPVDQS